MTDHFHAVIWMDHTDAKIFRFSATDAEPVAVHSHQSHQATHGHKGVDKEFYSKIIGAIDHSGAVLLTGPGSAKTEFKRYLAEHAAPIDKRISAVETVDHPSDGALLALARKFFKADDRMHAQR